MENVIVFERFKQLVKENIEGTRKGGDEPMYLHSWRVAECLKRHGYDQNVQLAGLLHDVIEDSDVSEAELRGMVGSERVVELVLLSSHDEAVKNKEARWMKMIAKIVEKGDGEALAIKTADILDNLRSCRGMKPSRRQVMRLVKAPMMYNLAAGYVAESLREEMRAVIEAEWRDEGIGEFWLDV